MEKTLAIILMIVALVLGAVGHAAIASDVEVIRVEVPVAGETVYVNQTVDKLVEVMVEPTYLSDAKAYLESELSDEEGLLTCEGYEYDYDDVSITGYKNDYVISVNDEDVTVDFGIKLKYKEEDRSSCREQFDATVFYEEDEDAELSFVLA